MQTESGFKQILLDFEMATMLWPFTCCNDMLVICRAHGHGELVSRLIFIKATETQKYPVLLLVLGKGRFVHTQWNVHVLYHVMLQCVAISLLTWSMICSHQLLSCMSCSMCFLKNSIKYCKQKKRKGRLWTNYLTLNSVNSNISAATYIFMFKHKTTWPCFCG